MIEVVIHTNGVFTGLHTSRVVGSCIEQVEQVESIFGLDTSQELTKVASSYHTQYKRGNTTYTMRHII